MSPVGDKQILEPVAVVLIKAIARTFGSVQQANSGEDKNVEPAIVVVVQKCTAAACHLDDVVLAVNAAIDHGVTQTSPCRDVLEACVERQSGRFSTHDSKTSRQGLVCVTPWTSWKRASKGNPEDFPRGWTAALRVATP